MEKNLNKLFVSVIAVLLAIISFFLIATYNKISDTNVRVYELQTELAKIRTQELFYMTYESTSALIDKKIAAYHKDFIIK
jgi:YbbR domain-containing protein